MLTNVPAPDHLQSFFAIICSVFFFVFFKGQQNKDGSDLQSDTAGMFTFQKTAASH